MEIIPYRDEHADAFYSLNRAWLDQHGLFEPHDDEQLRDPVGSIIAPGGAIFIGVRDSAVIGTSAIAPSGEGEMELIKLTVAETARGAGLGRRLAGTCLDFARSKGVRRVVLLSSSKLRTALAMYEDMGFSRRPLPPGVPYESADIYMVLDLERP